MRSNNESHAAILRRPIQVVNPIATEILKRMAAFLPLDGHTSKETAHMPTLIRPPKVTIQAVSKAYRARIDDAVAMWDLESLTDIPMLSWMNRRDVNYRLEAIKMLLAVSR